MRVLMAQNKFFRLSQITGRMQKILQSHIGKLSWVKAEISSGFDPATVKFDNPKKRWRIAFEDPMGQI